MDDLPRETLSLREFCALSAKLQGNEDTITDFVQLNVSGIYDAQQICVDPIRNRMTSREKFIIERDYDSLLSFSPHVCVSRNTDVAINVASDNREVLTKDIKFEYPFHIGGVRMFTFNGWLLH